MIFEKPKKKANNADFTIKENARLEERDRLTRDKKIMKDTCEIRTRAPEGNSLAGNRIGPLCH